MIPHSRPWLSDEDLTAMARVVRSEMIAQGHQVAEFEKRLAGWVGATLPGVAVASGAAALHLTLLALDVGEGDEVIIPSYVCQSVLEAVLATGAVPRLADVGMGWVLEPANVRPLVNDRTKAIVVPHMYGLYADVTSFRDFGVPLIEDCAQAVGERGRSLAGDVGVFSFHPTKCLTTGEGGMAITSEPNLETKLRTIRDGAHDSAQGRFLSPMSDIAAALGISQLSRYDAALRRRKQLAWTYIDAIDAINPGLVTDEVRTGSMFFRLPLRLAGGVDEYGDQFASRGVAVRRGVDKLLHRVVGESDDAFPVSTYLFKSTVSLPIYPALSDEEHRVCLDVTIEVLQRNSAKLPDRASSVR